MQKLKLVACLCGNLIILEFDDKIYIGVCEKCGQTAKLKFIGKGD